MEQARSAIVFLLGALLPCGSGCDDTVVQLVFHSRLRIPQELDAVCLQIAAGNKVHFSQRYALSVSDAGTPFSISVAAGDTYSESFEVLLRGERRGRPTAWLRQQEVFTESEVVQRDLYVDGCTRVKGSGKFGDGGRLTDKAGSAVALVQVPFAPSQILVLWSGQARRFAMLEGKVQQILGGLPQVLSSEVSRVPVLDLDGDCHLDLALLHKTQVVLWKNKGDGTFAEVPKDPVPLKGHFVDGAVADLNGDGLPDMVLVTAAGAAHLLLNQTQAPGTFRDASGQLPASGLDKVTAVDVGFINQDAHLDLVLARGSTTEEVNVVLLQSSDGTARFVKGPAPQEKKRTGAVALADLNGDGYDDLIAGNTKATSVVTFNNLGALDGSKTWAIPASIADEVLDLLAADLNNDCAVDLVLAQLKGIRIFLNSGKGSFSEVFLTSSAPQPATNLSAFDMTGDAQAEIVLGGDVGGARWLKQQ